MITPGLRSASAWLCALTLASCSGLETGGEDVLATPSKAQQPLTQSFAADSLIIPMDTTFQNSGTIQAFGLVYELLKQDIPVYWAILPGKTQGAVDFTASAVNLRNSAVITGHGYAGGPFVVDAADRASALPIVTSWLAQHPTNVHSATAVFAAPVAKTLRTPPRIAVFADGEEGIAFRYLNAAGILDSRGNSWPVAQSTTYPAHPDVVSIAAVRGNTGGAFDSTLLRNDGTPRFCHLTSMHYGGGSDPASNEVVREIRNWLTHPLTHGFMECEAIDAFENSVFGKFLTTAGVSTASGQAPSNLRNRAPDNPFSQFVGRFDGVGGSFRLMNLLAGSTYKGATSPVLAQDPAAAGDARVVWATGHLDGDPTKGVVSYLGGHEYPTSGTISGNDELNGTRVFLNSLFASPCSNEIDRPIVRLTKSAPATAVGGTVTFTIDWENSGAGYADEAVLEDPLPSGASFVSASNGGTEQNGKVVWNLGTLNPGASGSVTVTLQFATDGAVENTATLTYLMGVRQVTRLSNTTSTRVDVGPPDTFIDSAPSGTVGGSATFDFSASESPVTYECNLDGAGWLPCTDPMSYSGLGTGTHTLEVRAIDSFNNPDPTPASHAWAVDVTAPDTFIVSGPAPVSGVSSPAFDFDSDESGVTYQCELDGVVLGTCSDPSVLSVLLDGPHTLTVQAVDAVGNVDPTPASWTWMIDTADPETTIESGPPAATADSIAHFDFGSDETPVTYECSLDGAVFVSCADPESVGPLSDGAHTLTVRATDEAGNTDTTPASHSWTVDTTAPDTFITSGAPAESSGADATFSLGSDEAGVSYECSLDGATFIPCSETPTVTGLLEGPHTFAARATDALGHTDSTPASWSWNVDTVAPDTTIDSGPAVITAATSGTFEFSSDTPGATFECALDGAPFTPCADPSTFTGLADGLHSLEVRAVDAAGNRDPTPATYAWKVDTLGIDTDDDGLIDVDEVIHGTDPNVPDTDGDGVKDGTEVHDWSSNPLDDDTDDDGLIDGAEDQDGNGVLDATDTSPVAADTDGDGILDGTERGLTAPQGDDTHLAGFVPDADPTTTTHPRDTDTDDGSVLDGIEDANHNGRIDPGERDPNDPSDDLDADRDGLDDDTEVVIGTDPWDSDSDDDGVADGADGATDSDGDGRVDALDPDSDDDGLLDGTEMGVTSGTAPAGTDRTSPHFVPDTDPTTTTNPDDADTDEDGLDDGVEDADLDGFVDSAETDPNDPDSDDDALTDGIEITGANPTDPLDSDTDNDGRSDGAEDANHSGSVDAGETDPNLADTDDDGLLDGVEVHGENPTDPLNPNTDGDDLNDGAEDVNHNGRVDPGERDPNVFDTPEEQLVEPLTPPRYGVRGGGCSSTGDGSPVWALMLMGLTFLALRRERATGSGKATVAVAVVLFGLSARDASAQNASTAIDVQLFKPAPGHGGILNLHGASLDDHLDWKVGAFFNYADSPLIIYQQGSTFAEGLVEQQFTMDLIAAVSFRNRFELGFGMPLALQGGRPTTALNGTLSEGVSRFGTGDLRIAPKLLLFDNHSLRLAAVATTFLPTGHSGAFLGDGSFGFQPRAVVDYVFQSGLRFVANAGVNLRRSDALLNLNVGNEFAWGVGGELPFRLQNRKFQAVANVVGAFGFEQDGAEELPVELLAGLRHELFSGLNVDLGVGRGLSNGYGTPRARVVAGLTWEVDPGRRIEPAAATQVAKCTFGPEDYDGFEDGDGCADPDNDRDGIADAPDVCPYEAETVNDFLDQDGCPDRPRLASLRAPQEDGDADQDGIADLSLDRCPGEPEDLDGFEDQDGCPEPDNDSDGITDAKDTCPLEAEVINGRKDDDGCPDTGKSKVLLESNRIVILDKVYFATNKATILKRSHDLLRQVAAIIKANPQLRKIRVEGHTDDRGKDAHNLELSQRRADSVRAFLVTSGADPAVLDAVGYGETRPVDVNLTSKGREKNRRVEFNIVDPAPDDRAEGGAQ